MSLTNRSPAPSNARPLARLRISANKCEIRITVRKLFYWKLKQREIKLGERTMLMGVLNVTPDSFSDGGKYSDPDRAFARAVTPAGTTNPFDTTIAPARIPADTAIRAEAIARHVAEKLDLVGVLAVEMFVTEGGAILVNEIAPRPHNSGHWTIDACYTSQFEQLVRAICGLPLGSVERHSDAVMKNLLGGDVAKWRDALNDPLAKLHLYGKTEIQPGRKMGHVTRLIPHR